jgi:hypothetical protein
MAESTIGQVVVGVEDMLAPLGLMEGEYAVPKRMLLGAAVGTLAVQYIEPASMYDRGVERPWAFFDNDSRNGPQPTWTPWFLGPIVGAVVLGMFV